MCDFSLLPPREGHARKANDVYGLSYLMQNTGFFWILLSIVLYGGLHSLLASNRVKGFIARLVGGNAYRRFYRLFFSITGGITFLPTLTLVALLPDRTIYAIPMPWVLVTRLIQVVALLGLAYGVLQTGAFAFVGITQALHGAGREKLVTTGLYRWVRHPLYTCTLAFLWLASPITWNLFALNLGVSAYFWIGSIFEERKLVQQFGQGYEEYRVKTPRMIPKIKI